MSRSNWLRLYRVRILLVCLALLCLYYGLRINEETDMIKLLGMNSYWWFSGSPTPYNILLIGYLRGGTTFVGEILGLRNDSFYVYEPLHKMSMLHYFKPGYMCSMEDASCRIANGTDNKALDVLRAVYNCDARHYQDQLRTWQHMKSRGILSINDRRWKLAFPECNGNWKGCPEKYERHCSMRSSIVIKEPRLSISFASNLLDTFSNLKIIYLLRDPRAIMNSRAQLNWGFGAISLCNKMTYDYIESGKLKEVHPGRIYTVFYEDITTNPIETVRKIYDFAGYDYNAYEQLRLTKMTSSSEKGEAGNTNRRNSTETAFAWRNKIKENVLKETDKACSHLYSEIGYPQIAL
ncbi:carbohydrate sulfotransferase 1-like [Ylistrum balloti]|uniref:carbohydrate sulfotransferase 1-like n=1 Tax=Ylistrum balloti TaxID=509963 RepID=UPI002905BD86|nr:carbohydrate sulfotransferase 1-like [Ylistrum balloti]